MSRAIVALVVLVALSACAWSQEEILTFSTEPAVLEMAPGGRAAGRLEVSNASPYEADDIEFAWTGTADLALNPLPESLAALGAFASASMEFTLAAVQTASLGEVRGSFEAIYTYCVGDVCYQMVDSIPVTVRIAAVPQSAPAVAGGVATADDTAEMSVSWRWIAFAVAALLVVPAILLRRGGRGRVILMAALAVAGGVTLGLGVSLGQHRQAQAVGAVLCTSCVGIETVETLAPRLSSAQAAAVEHLTSPIDLLVFYAPWCRSCPYAEAMVGLMASRNPLLRYRLVNAEAERDLAAQHGITRAGRTVVPAILRVDTGKVVFGAENLGDRLVNLLAEGT